MDAGRYGFVKLQYYTENQGFDNVYTFTDCRSLFEDLWVEWLDTKLYLMAKGTPLLEKDTKVYLRAFRKKRKKSLWIKKPILQKGRNRIIGITASGQLWVERFVAALFIAFGHCVQKRKGESRIWNQ